MRRRLPPTRQRRSATRSNRALVSLIHLGPGAAGFQKAQGRHSVAARMLLAPYLLAARINQRLWCRRGPDRDLVCDGVWLGALPARAEPVDGRLPALVDLTAELRRAAASIETLRAAGPVRVCCALGRGRSAAAVAARRGR